ncbi:MAG: alkaline phosphatase family protein, partial [Candidatus Binatia bacterium]|nr:alkaline phosphatase family protein [Candidatus Binatia bacterium]
MEEPRPFEHKSDSPCRVIVIGLDAADPDLVQLWSREGRLPFLRALMQSGAWVRVISSRTFSNYPWPSFSTGVSPGRHGLYSFLQLQRGTTEIVQTDPRACPYPPFWQSLRGSGKRVAVFDVPKTYPLEGIEGVQITAWGEEYPLLDPSSFPPSLVKELSARFGRYRHPVEIPGRNSISRGLRIYDMLRRNLERKSQAAQFLFVQDDWDLFMVVFAEAHYGGHHFYHHFATDHWDYDPRRAARLGHALPTLYTELDTALAGLLEGISDDVIVFIVSVQGIATNYSGNHLMPTVLEKLGFQVSAFTTGGVSPGGEWSRRLREFIPSRARAFVNEHLLPQSFHRKMYARQFRRSIDWRKTTAFFLPNEHFQGFISVNLQGREPWGTIAPGTEYREVCGRLVEELKQLINPQTG